MDYEDRLKRAAAETDTFSFVITREDADSERTLSTDSLELAGSQILAWIASRILHSWEATGNAPKCVVVDVKVGVE